jgi:hypothetical protein
LNNLLSNSFCNIYFLPANAENQLNRPVSTDMPFK